MLTPTTYCVLYCHWDFHVTAVITVFSYSFLFILLLYCVFYHLMVNKVVSEAFTERKPGRLLQCYQKSHLMPKLFFRRISTFEDILNHG